MTRFWDSFISEYQRVTGASTVKTTAEKIAVMQAYVDGKAVQCRFNGLSDTWDDRKEPTWNWSHCDYRIKPEPRYVWVTVYSDGQMFAHPSLKLATRATSMTHLNLTHRIRVEIPEEPRFDE